MLDGSRGVGREPDRPLEFLDGGFLPRGTPLLRRRPKPEAKVDLLQIFRFVEESLEIQTRVGIPDGLIVDGIAHIEVVDGRPLVPAIVRRIACRAREIIKHRNLAERGAIRGREGLIIVPGSAKTFNRLPDGVSPIAILVGEELLIDSADCLLYPRRSVACKREAQRLDDVPCQVELAIPKEILADLHGQLEVNVYLSAGLLLIIIAADVGEEGKVVEHPVYSPVLEKPRSLAFPL